MSYDAKELSKPFTFEEIEWKPQTYIKQGTAAIMVPFISNRAIMQRLDDIVGPMNWKNEFKEWGTTGKNQLCGLSVYNPEIGQWIVKWDGADSSDIKAFKGGLSDAMKRAAVQWGIGRYLYNFNNALFCDIEEKRLKKGQEGKMRAYYESEVKVLFGTIPMSNIPAPQTPSVRPPAPATVPVQTTLPSAWPEEWKPRIAELKGALGIKQNEGLNDFVQKFLNKETATFKDIGPENCMAFCTYLEANSGTI